MVKEAVKVVLPAPGKGPHEQLLVWIAMKSHFQLYHSCKPAQQCCLYQQPTKLSVVIPWVPNIAHCARTICCSAADQHKKACLKLQPFQQWLMVAMTMPDCWWRWRPPQQPLHPGWVVYKSRRQVRRTSQGTAMLDGAGTRIYNQCGSASMQLFQICTANVTVQASTGNEAIKQERGMAAGIVTHNSRQL